MIPNYSMIPAAAIRWSPVIRWSPAIRWSIRSMDFDNRKVYGDTSITDGLVFFKENQIIRLTCDYQPWLVMRKMCCQNICWPWKSCSRCQSCDSLSSVYPNKFALPIHHCVTTEGSVSSMWWSVVVLAPSLMVLFMKVSVQIFNPWYKRKKHYPMDNIHIPTVKIKSH